MRKDRRGGLWEGMVNVSWGWVGDGDGRRVVMGGWGLGWAESVEIDGVSRCSAWIRADTMASPECPWSWGRSKSPSHRQVRERCIEGFCQPCMHLDKPPMELGTRLRIPSPLRSSGSPGPIRALSSLAFRRGAPLSSPGAPRYTQATVFEARGREVRLRLGDPVGVRRGTAQR